MGECNASDIDELQKLVLTNADCDIPDFSKPPWDQAILVTPRQSVRHLWNEVTNTLLQDTSHCNKMGNQWYVVTCASQRHITRRERGPNNGSEVSNSGTNRQINYLRQTTVQMAIRMKSMVLLNLRMKATALHGKTSPR